MTDLTSSVPSFRHPASSGAMRLFRPAAAAMLVLVATAVPVRAQAVSPAQGTAPAGQTAAPPAPSGIEYRWDNRPELQLGRYGEVAFRARLDSTLRTRDADMGRDEADLDWGSRRVQIEGTLFQRFEFEWSHEFGDPDEPERDAFVNYRYRRALEIQGGRFKVPFGRDALQSRTNLDFAYRSLAGRQISPGRDVGLMAHGQLFGPVLSYEAGYFTHDGDNMRSGGSEGGAHAVGGRVMVSPFEANDASVWEHLEFGVALLASRVDDRLGLRGRTVFRDGEFFERVFVNGRRLRRGVEGGWRRGPYAVSGEVMAASDARDGMGLTGEALPSVTVTGWYLAGSWTVTGETKNGRITPERPLFRGGYGAVEVAARLERMTFSDAPHPGSAANAPRLDTLLGNGERVLTLGGSWYLDRHFRVIGNLVFERVDDPARSPSPRTDGRFPSGVMLVQFVM